MKKTEPKRLMIFFFVLYILTVLWYTVLRRTSSYYAPQFELFWSYKGWFAGDTELGWKILENIAMFIPFGFFLRSLQHRGSVTFICALLFSLMIEMLQMTLMRGLFEWDDVINNVLGAAAGWGLCWTAQRWRIPVFPVALVFMAVCWGVFHFTPEPDNTRDPVKYFCFQIDEAKLDGHELTLKGFALCYGQPRGEPKIILRSPNQSVLMNVTYGSRPDIEQYYDRECVGFTAVGIVDDAAEHEILIRFPWVIPVSTGVYITGENVHYMPEAAFAAPDLDDPFVTDGIPLVYRPDEHCWIYQYRDELYWIAEEGFNFENDGSTYIQFQLWTTQIDRLPAKRLENNWFWDNIGGYFEKNEIDGDFGTYRVMKRKIPHEYGITVILTGYYTDQQWVWQEFFRPYYNALLVTP